MSVDMSVCADWYCVASEVARCVEWWMGEVTRRRDEADAGAWCAGCVAGVEVAEVAGWRRWAGGGAWEPPSEESRFGLDLGWVAFLSNSGGAELEPDGEACRAVARPVATRLMEEAVEEEMGLPRAELLLPELTLLMLPRAPSVPPPDAAGAR